MKILLDDVAGEQTSGVWVASASPHQLAMLGQPKSTRGPNSVLLVTSPTFDRTTRQLVLDADRLIVLNLGTTKRTIVVDSGGAAEAVDEGNETAMAPVSEGPGDREFRLLAEQLLHSSAQEAAIDLIRQVRRRWPGDLKRGDRNNFSNTPDNFWYVIVQPRTQAMSITVRGVPADYESSIFKLVTDRPGYTRFTVRSPEDVTEAIRLIQASLNRVKRRRI